MKIHVTPQRWKHLATQEKLDKITLAWWGKCVQQSKAPIHLNTTKLCTTLSCYETNSFLHAYWNRNPKYPKNTIIDLYEDDLPTHTSKSNSSAHFHSLPLTFWHHTINQVVLSCKNTSIIYQLVRSYGIICNQHYIQEVYHQY